MDRLFRTKAYLLEGNRWLAAYLAPRVLLLVIAVWAVPALAEHQPRTFIAVINGGQEVPPTTSDAFGVAFMTFDEATKMLCFSITHSGGGLQGTETAAHFHGPATAEHNAGILFTLPLGNPKNDCVGPLSEEQEDFLRKGLVYINIHSVLLPDGELRGQVIRTRRAEELAE